MREILFRGKSVISGHWIYGMFCDEDYDSSVPCIVPHDSCYVELSEWEVDRNTVGQYTGIDDRNGKKIFEGDIVNFTRTNALGYTNRRIGEVRYYDKLPIFYIMATTGDAWDWVECNDIEVIGNIHGNPEILEVLK